MAADIIPLVELFGEMPDFRQASGKRYPLAAILALACAAMLCGYRSYGAIAEWGRNYGRELVTALGFAEREDALCQYAALDLPPPGLRTVRKQAGPVGRAGAGEPAAHARAGRGHRH